MPTAKAFVRRTPFIMLAVLLGWTTLSACTSKSTTEIVSQEEYLTLAEGWMERDIDIRERAAAAAVATTNTAFPGLADEAEALRTEIADVEPPEACTELHESFVACEEHFAKAMSLLANGDDFAAIDELALSSMAKRELKAELKQLGVRLRGDASGV